MKSFKLDNKGQLSLEFILISMISILVMSLISVPILGLSIDYSNDVMDSLNAKNELNKITDAIDFCYSSGKGSKKIVLLELNKDIVIHFSNNNSKGSVTADIGLSDNSSKQIFQSFDYPLLTKDLQLSRGFNKIEVCWSEDDDLIEISKIY